MCCATSKFTSSHSPFLPNNYRTFSPAKKKFSRASDCQVGINVSNYISTIMYSTSLSNAWKEIACFHFLLFLILPSPSSFLFPSSKHMWRFYISTLKKWGKSQDHYRNLSPKILGHWIDASVCLTNISCYTRKVTSKIYLTIM